MEELEKNLTSGADGEETAAPSAPPPRRRRGRRLLRKKRRRQGFWCFLAGLAAAALLAAGARIWQRHIRYEPEDRFVWDYRREYAESGGKGEAITIPSWPIGQGAAFQVHWEHGENQTAQEIYRLVNPAVVTVLVDLGNETAAVGTGVIFTEDGYFVTNYHVVDGGTDCLAVMDSGASFPALFVAGDEEHDLAVLKLDCQEPLPAAEFGDSDLLTVGDDVYAIGNPLGVEFRGTLTNGIVSAINRDVEVDGRVMTLIQTNAALNSGNSGGPLINGYGQVVGINVVKMSSTHSTVEGLGFAIPSASMDRLVNDLLAYGEAKPEPLLGLSVSMVGEEVAQGLWGIEVLSVVPGSPAETAGIQEGDYVIAAAGQNVSSSADLLRVRRRYYEGDEMPLEIWRSGERMEVLLLFREG